MFVVQTKFYLEMWRKKQYKALIKSKLEYFIKQTNFSRDTIPDIIEIIGLSPEEILRPYILAHSSLMQSIKWFIFLHHLLMLKPKIDQESIESLIQLINVQKQSSSIFQAILQHKMVVPYKAYLLKRNSFNLKEISPQFHNYALMNLLKLGISFTNIVFTIGRYLLKTNSFLIDFNIVMAKDLSSMYNTLNLKIDQNFINQNLQLIERLNQEMYNVFYNCYFSKFVSKLAPEWIDTDILNPNNIQQMASTRLHTQTLYKTQKAQKIVNTEIYNNITLQNEEKVNHLKDQIKSTSMIATLRSSACLAKGQLINKQKQNHQREDFIHYVESLLGNVKEMNNNCQA